MSREEFVSALVRSPRPGEEGQVAFDFSRVSKAPCICFVYTPVVPWDEEGSALEECWQEYMLEFEKDLEEV